MRYNDFMYTAKQLSRIFNCSVETIRLQSLEFKDYLEPRSNAGRQRMREYSDRDLTVFALIHEMKNAGKLYPDIHAALSNGERAIPPDIPANALGNELARASTLQAKIALLQSEIERLRSIERRNIELEALAVDYRRQIDVLQEKIDRLNQRIGRLEGDKEN